MTKDDGGAAFPLDGYVNGKKPARHAGMSLRDWFAGQTLGGLLAHAVLPDSVEQMSSPNSSAELRLCAGIAYAIADAMLAERGKP